MVEQVKKDIVVIAREGYSVLLEIDGRMFDIDCYKPINLSKIFPKDILERCTSLSTHLKDGNLVFFEEGTKLSENTIASVAINPLREEAAKHITSQYDQVERDVNRTNMELETRANITENTRKQIQEQVQAGKKEILQIDKNLSTKTVQAIQTTNKTDKPKECQNAMTSKELTLKVSMDVSREAFAKKMTASKNKLEAAEIADEAAAEAEINKQNTE